TFRSLVKGLNRRGHEILFLERDVPYYAQSRDMPDPDFCELGLYASVEDLKERFEDRIRSADFVMVGSYVPEGIAVGEWVTDITQGVTAFYDIDTPVTIASLSKGDCRYLSPGIIPVYDLYCSFSGGPILGFIAEKYRA